MGGEAHNSSGLPPFILTGLPGMETSQHWLFLLLGVLYTVSIVGNALILFIIKEEESLHQPMYYFLSLLSLNDLGVSFSTLTTVLAIASREERLKTLNTCVSHLCAVLIFYVPMVGVSMAARYGRHAPRYVHTLLSLVYLFVPPMLNPVIYSIKTKEIRRRLHKILLGTKI